MTYGRAPCSPDDRPALSLSHAPCGRICAQSRAGAPVAALIVRSALPHAADSPCTHSRAKRSSLGSSAQHDDFFRSLDDKGLSITLARPVAVAGDESGRSGDDGTGMAVPINLARPVAIAGDEGIGGSKNDSVTPGVSTTPRPSVVSTSSCSIAG